MWRYSRGFPSIYRDRMGRLASSDVAAEMGSDRFGPTSSDVAVERHPRRSDVARWSKSNASKLLRRCGRSPRRYGRTRAPTLRGARASKLLRRCGDEDFEAAPTLLSESKGTRSRKRFGASPTLRCGHVALWSKAATSRSKSSSDAAGTSGGRNGSDVERGRSRAPKAVPTLPGGRTRMGLEGGSARSGSDVGRRGRSPRRCSRSPAPTLRLEASPTLRSKAEGCGGKPRRCGSGGGAARREPLRIRVDGPNCLPVRGAH